jgi:hypothetical protein
MRMISSMGKILDNGTVRREKADSLPRLAVVLPIGEPNPHNVKVVVA